MIYKIHRSFSLAHFYHQPQWDEAKNKQEFGLCFTKYGHGHDYKLEVEIETEKLEIAAQVIDELIKKLDHQHLNFEIPEFKSLIPTTENMALYIQKQLSGSIPIRRLKLFETADIWVELSYR